MTIEAIVWAFKQKIKPSSLKFVLVALADNCSVDGSAWPSIHALSEKTGQDRKTIIAALDKLESMGIITDSGKRVGATGQVKVYRFNCLESGTVPQSEQYQKRNSTVSQDNSTVFPGKSTENGTRNLKEPLKEPSLSLIAKTIKCPQQEIIDEYHRILPMCPRVYKWTEKREKALRCRWDEDKRHQSMEFWTGLFEYIAKCSFLVGKTRENFTVTLEWIVNQSNFLKIVEGNYEDKVSSCR